MLARSSFIILLAAALLHALCGTCRTGHALCHAEPAAAAPCCADHDHHPAAAQHTDRCELCGDHDPSAPDHSHVCRTESTPARLRGSLDLPQSTPVLIAIPPDLAGADALAPSTLGPSSARRTSTGPPPSIRTTRLLI